MAVLRVGHIRLDLAALPAAIQSRIWTARPLVGPHGAAHDPSVMQTGYGQFCPIALASEVLTQRWMTLIARELLAGSTRFNDIRRGVPKISASLLKQRLETLEHAGIVRKRRAASGSHDYVLTKAGQELRPILGGLGEWGQRWARDIEPADLDPGWLVWNIHRRMNVAQMPRARTVIEIEFTDAPQRQRHFWLVTNAGEVDVCLKPPGYAVDLSVRCAIRTLAEVWRGLRPLKQAIRFGEIELRGPSALCKSFPSWLLLSVYAPIERPR
jgi:DNA-binding HxlR family transcriptional regulator